MISLETATDAEHGHGARQRDVEQCRFVLVPLDLGRIEIGEGLLVVASRVDVGPAREHDAVEATNQLLRHHVNRQVDGQTARCVHGIGVGGDVDVQRGIGEVVGQPLHLTAELASARQADQGRGPLT